MIYVGFVITIEEALRLFNLEEILVSSYYDTMPIQRFLKELDSRFVFTYIDKGSCLFGVEVPRGLDEESIYTTVDKELINILLAKQTFLTLLKEHKFDTSKVYITMIEEESILVENPEPYLVWL